MSKPKTISIITTYTYALVPVSQSTFDEVQAVLKAANYDHCFITNSNGQNIINMNELALVVKE
jgi:hypothetical protein